MARQDRAGGSTRTNLYDEITGKIITELEAGRFPWVQPWGKATATAPLGLPQNASSGRRYPEPVNWHRTALHELGHATGHPSRLNRDFSGSFGTRKYAFE